LGLRNPEKGDYEVRAEVRVFIGYKAGYKDPFKNTCGVFNNVLQS
jgi:hypothetical protein